MSRRNLVGDNRLYGIEMLRIVMALAIVIWHYQHLAFAVNPKIPFIREQQPFYSAFSWFYEHGAYRVPTFWCISGFIFYWLYKESIPARTVSGREFLVLRVSRLLPLHWLTLLLVAFLQGIYYFKNGSFFVYIPNDLKHFVMQIFLVSDWGFGDGFSFNGPIWAVSVEVVILILFYVLLRTLGGSIRVTLTALLTALALRLWGQVNSPIVDCALYFFAGGVAAQAFSWHEALKRRRKTVYGLVVILSITSLWAWNKEGLLLSQETRPYLLMVYLPVIIFLIARPAAVPAVMTRPVRFLSNSTYAIYLIHFPLQLLLACLYTYAAKPIPFYNPWFFSLFMLTTVALSVWINRVFEQPMQSWLRQRLGSRTSLGKVSRAGA